MAITDDQKLDLLFKKIGFGVAKTDSPTNKAAFNEAIPSPLLMRVIRFGMKQIRFLVLNLLLAMSM